MHIIKYFSKSLTFFHSRQLLKPESNTHKKGKKVKVSNKKAKF